VSFNPRANDADADGNSVTIHRADGATQNRHRRIGRYTACANHRYVGPDSFTYSSGRSAAPADPAASRCDCDRHRDDGGPRSPPDADGVSSSSPTRWSSTPAIDRRRWRCPDHYGGQHGQYRQGRGDDHQRWDNHHLSPAPRRARPTASPTPLQRQGRHQQTNPYPLDVYDRRSRPAPGSGRHLSMESRRLRPELHHGRPRLPNQLPPSAGREPDHVGTEVIGGVANAGSSGSKQTTTVRAVNCRSWRTAWPGPGCRGPWRGQPGRDRHLLLGCKLANVGQSTVYADHDQRQWYAALTFQKTLADQGANVGQWRHVIGQI